MENEDLNLDLDNIENQVDKNLKVKNRFQELSEKVKLTSQERDEKNALLIERDAQLANTSKERDFYKGFSSSVAKYPNAAEFQDKILEKVKAGYDVDDATISVLAKEGKLTNVPQEVQRPDTQVAGGSAATSFTGDKQLSDMTGAEKYEALKEADKAGELANALRGGR